MADFTEDQRTAIRFYGGWSEGFVNLYQRVEAALQRLNDLPSAKARITNPIDGAPPGILALLDQLSADIFAARKRFKASKVGSIELNGGEVAQLCRLGRMYASQLCQLLGIPKARDVFSPSAPDDYAREGWPATTGSAGGNFIGK